jgi:HJR/Mrr/RecB family endonuclease
MSRRRRTVRGDFLLAAVLAAAAVYVGRHGIVGMLAADFARSGLALARSVAVPVATVLAAAGTAWLGLRRARRRLGLGVTLAQVDRMTGPEFEQLVGALFRRDCYTGVRAGGGAGDLGLDVLAYEPARTGLVARTLGRLPWLRWSLGSRRVVVQCKRYALGHQVGSEVVQTFLGTYRYVHHADVGVIVTTTTVTGPARRLAEQQGVVIVDRAPLIDWLAGAPLRLPAPRPWAGAGVAA